MACGDAAIAAAAIVDPAGRHQVELNLQGDTPNLAPEDLASARAMLPPLA